MRVSRKEDTVNQTLTKKMFIACAITAMALTPMFADGRDNNARPPRDGRAGHEDRHCDCMGFPHPGMPDYRGEPVLMGTVQSVDTSNSVITVKDADGESKSVHINPLTAIVRLTPPPAPSADGNGAAPSAPPAPSADGSGAAPSAPPAPPAPPSPLDISSIESGDFVSVRNFNTGTATLEASNIVIHDF